MWGQFEGHLTGQRPNLPICTSECEAVCYLQSVIKVLHERINRLESRIMQQERVLNDDGK